MHTPKSERVKSAPGQTQAVPRKDHPAYVAAVLCLRSVRRSIGRRETESLAGWIDTPQAPLCRRGGDAIAQILRAKLCPETGRTTVAIHDVLAAAGAEVEQFARPLRVGQDGGRVI